MKQEFDTNEFVPTDNDYLCPNCGSPDHSNYEPPTPESGFWFLPTICDKCCATWDEILVITAVANLKVTV